ncbi:MAG: cyclopropane-fatty-acyl-phospholipid synthase [Actinomycetota bacterium]|nr:cyclopropane-fatty-acyl-phospholipid synthase [Actinomycetota bacterium]
MADRARSQSDELATHGVAKVLAPVAQTLLGRAMPVQVRCWDGSRLGPDSGPTLYVTSPKAVRQLLWEPSQVGLARALLAGQVSIEGDVVEVLERLVSAVTAPDAELPAAGWRDRLAIVKAAASLGALGLPERPPPEEARLRGRLHSPRRDAEAVSHHYDVSNEFYRLFLGPTMTYSCAYWPAGVDTLDQAQTAKYELVARKLGLEPGKRLLDVGCGWGGMALHAASVHGCEVVGITISQNQAELARQRVEDADLGDRIEIRLQDYRDVDDAGFDAISSIGMFEHVGPDQLREYFTLLLARLRPGGRLLNHGIARPTPGGGGRPDPHSFVNRYIFPDGDLREVGQVITLMEGAGFEVRDLECLREHYGRTLRAWAVALQSSWSEAVEQVGERRALIWLIYLAGCAVSFEEGATTIHQVLAVRPDGGRSGLPASRAQLMGWDDPQSLVTAPTL